MITLLKLANLTYPFGVDSDTSTYVTMNASKNVFHDAAETSTIFALLSQTTSEDVTVNFAFSGTATDDVDYSKSTSSLVIASGQTSGSLTVTCLTDGISDPDDTIIIDISGVTNAVEYGIQQLTITIREQVTQNGQSIGLRPKLGLGL